MMEKKTDKRQRTIPLISIIIVLAVGIIASLLILILGKTSKEADSKLRRSAHTVNFFDENMELVSTVQVEDGDHVLPPMLENTGEGHALRGWNKDLSSIWYDTDFEPVYLDLSDESNAFYIDAVYVEGGASFAVDLYWGGAVNASSVVLKLSYDTDMMHFDGASGMANVTSPSEGLLEISFCSDFPFTERNTLAQLRFTAENVSMMRTELVLSVEKATTVENGSEKNADCIMANGIVFIF